MRKAAVGYIRVSTQEHSREGISLEMQIAKIRKYCELNDLPLVGIYGDPGVSGKSIKARPGIQAVLEMVRRKRVKHVVIYKLDRLARNTIEALETARLMDKKGVALHSISEKLDTKSAVGRFFFTLLASLAEMERGIVSERTRAALGQKRANGQKTGGYIPFGYRLAGDGRTLEADPQEQEVISAIRMRRADGWSLSRIAENLNQYGIKTKKGTRWTHVQVRRVLSQPGSVTTQPLGPRE